MSTPEPGSRTRFALFAFGLALALAIAACLGAAALIFRRQIYFLAIDQPGALVRAPLFAAVVLGTPILLGALLMRTGMRGRGHVLTPARWAVLVALPPLTAVALFTGGWLALYPDPKDYKNLGYVLWKNGYRRMDLDDATEAVIRDPQRDTLLIGKTEGELGARFEYLVPPGRADAYEQLCFSESDWGKGPGERLMFVRASALAVVFKNGRTTDYVLMKGC